MIRVLAVLLALTGAASAETARVYSGEHADFTRLVVELPKETGWTVGKTPMGYAFAATGEGQPVYDIATVWDRIPKTRLQALRSDPATGALQLTLACACHVFPFEYQPGIIVLDIKPGPAPSGSAFEQAFVLPDQGASDPVLAATKPPAYDWLDAEASAPDPTPDLETDLPTGETSLDPLRAELLEQISRGAAQGVVDMALPGKPVELAPEDRGALPWSQIIIGPPADVMITDDTERTEERTPEGQACLADAVFALADWGGNRRPLDLLAEARSDLYEEFDTVDQVAALRAVRLHLYLGFGAEAAQYAALLDEDATGEGAVLRSLAKLVDGEGDPVSPFADMLGCDTAAALWAALAQPDFPAGAVVNTDAIVRSFLALPPHLRASLGPRLTETLLAHGDQAAAQILRNAIERTPDVSSAAVALLDAQANLHDDNGDAALDHAQTAVAEDGSGIAEWLTLVEAHFQKLQPMTAEQVVTLQSFEGELENLGLRHDLHRALALANILSGQAQAGFRIAETEGLPLSDPWKAAVALATDDDFLRLAVPNTSPDVTTEVETAIATRLANLGFPDAAVAWLGPITAADSPERRRLAARVELARGDARQVIALLDGLTNPEDEELRARALVQLGQIPAARDAYTAGGQTDQALRLATWEGDWADLTPEAAPLWADAVPAPAADPSGDLGPLARGEAILAATAASRLSVETLLAEIAAPNP